MNTDEPSRRSYGQTTDARGRTVRQLDPFTLRLARRYDVIPRDALDAIAREIGSGLEKGLRVSLIISLVCLTIGLIVITEKAVRMLLAGTFGSLQLLRAAVPFMSAVSGPLILWIIATRARAQKTKRIMLGHLRCPHCGYDLRGLPPDPTDGAVVCPECGCAWTVPTV